MSGSNIYSGFGRPKQYFSGNVVRVKREQPRTYKDTVGAYAPTVPQDDFDSLTLGGIKSQAMNDAVSVQKPQESAGRAVKSVRTEKSMSEDITMQELERLLISRGIFKVIDGGLYLWEGHFYRMVSQDSFANVCRNLMEPREEYRIKTFSKFKECMQFMLANKDLCKPFDEEASKRVQVMVPFQNGFYFADTDKLKKHNVKYPVLFCVNANYLGYDERTPTMDQLIGYATDFDEDAIERFYQMLGYIISHGKQGKCFFVLATAPNSGKSIVGDFLGRLLGEEYIATLELHKFGQQFAMGSLYGKILNYNMDLPQGKIKAEASSMLKTLTGDSRAHVDIKYVQGKTHFMNCKLMFGSNHPVVVAGNDDAFYDRMVLIPFISSVDRERQDHNLQERLWEERDAIVTKAAHAYRRLVRNNFIFQPCELADDMIASWRGESSLSSTGLMTEFWKSKVQTGDSSKDFTPTDIVFASYKEFCHEAGVDIDDNEKIKFSKDFREMFSLKKEKHRLPGYTSPVNGFVGIRIIDEDIEAGV